MNEPIAAIASAAPARPLLRHRVAVDAGHHRRGLARNAHQDRGRRAAVHGAVVDAGEQHDRDGRISPNVAGSSRLMPASGPSPGSMPTSVPIDAAEQRVDEHRRRQRDREAEMRDSAASRHGTQLNPKGPRGSGTRSRCREQIERAEARSRAPRRRDAAVLALDHAEEEATSSADRERDSRAAPAR